MQTRIDELHSALHAPPIPPPYLWAYPVYFITLSGNRRVSLERPSRHVIAEYIDLIVQLFGLPELMFAYSAPPEVVGSRLSCLAGV